MFILPMFANWNLSLVLLFFFQNYDSDVKFDKTLQDFEVEIFQCFASLEKKASERAHTHILETILHKFERSSEYDLKNFPNISEACDICNPVSIVLK